MPSWPKSVSQKKQGEIGLGSQKMPESGDLQDAQHIPNKIPTVEEKNWVSSAQSCSERSESIEQTFMDKGAVPQGTKDEKNKKKQKKWEENFQPSSKRFQLFGKNDKSEGQQKKLKS